MVTEVKSVNLLHFGFIHKQRGSGSGRVYLVKSSHDFALFCKSAHKEKGKKLQKLFKGFFRVGVIVVDGCFPFHS